MFYRCVYTVIGCCTSASQLCTHVFTHSYCHLGIYNYTYTSGRSTMQVMVKFCIRIATSCRCMSSLRGGPRALNQLHRARRYAKMANLPPAISQAPEGPHGRGTFGTPNRTISSVLVGWWRSGAANINWKTPVDIFSNDMEIRCLEPWDRC
jgi:hypothetical protein